jgi:hypothetical protein
MSSPINYLNFFICKEIFLIILNHKYYQVGVFFQSTLTVSIYPSIISETTSKVVTYFLNCFTWKNILKIEGRLLFHPYLLQKFQGS